MEFQARCALTLGPYYALVLWLGSASAQIPPGYYDSVDTTSATTLRQTLHDVIDDHTRFPYRSTATDTWNILEAADEDPSNSNNIIDLYGNTSIAKEGRGNDFYNREHTWPNSYGYPIDNRTNYPYTDCHALFLCDSGYNFSRGSKPYRFCNARAASRFSTISAAKTSGAGRFSESSSDSSFSLRSLYSGTLAVSRYSRSSIKCG